MSPKRRHAWFTETRTPSRSSRAAALSRRVEESRARLEAAYAEPTDVPDLPWVAMQAQRLMVNRWWAEWHKKGNDLWLACVARAEARAARALELTAAGAILDEPA